MQKDDLIKVVEFVVNCLYDKNYFDLLQKDYAPRMTSAHIEDVLARYPGNLTLPPQNAYHSMDIYQVQDRNEYKIDFDLWFNAEPSDLTLNLRVIKMDDATRYNVEDIRVM